MKQTDATHLIQKAITGTQPQNWADLGSGSGTFTLALKSILPEGSQLTAVDKQNQNLPVPFIKADFEKDDLPLSGLDGILIANAIHYASDKTKLIKKLEPILPGRQLSSSLNMTPPHQTPGCPIRSTTKTSINYSQISAIHP